MSQHREALTEMMRILKPGAMAFVSVTRTLPGKDPRNVYPVEWGRILQDFHQIDNGGTMTYRWVILQK
jgi:ubiquinone/menaquinone biosynthesis C-methylase UbiE